MACTDASLPAPLHRPRTQTPRNSHSARHGLRRHTSEGGEAVHFLSQAVLEREEQPGAEGEAAPHAGGAMWQASRNSWAGKASAEPARSPAAAGTAYGVQGIVRPRSVGPQAPAAASPSSALGSFNVALPSFLSPQVTRLSPASPQLAACLALG